MSLSISLSYYLSLFIFRPCFIIISIFIFFIFTQLSICEYKKICYTLYEVSGYFTCKKTSGRTFLSMLRAALGQAAFYLKRRCKNKKYRKNQFPPHAEDQARKTSLPDRKRKEEADSSCCISIRKAGSVFSSAASWICRLPVCTFPFPCLFGGA